jgi:DNA-binding IclR family transcriptional regulator
MTAHTVDARDSCALDKVDVGDLVQMVKAEYLEMPGLSLTLAQAQRLWNLDRATCVGALGQLVESGFLWRTEAGIYERYAPDLQFVSQDTKYQ